MLSGSAALIAKTTAVIKLSVTIACRVIVIGTIVEAVTQKLDTVCAEMVGMVIGVTTLARMAPMDPSAVASVRVCPTPNVIT